MGSATIAPFACAAFIRSWSAFRFIGQPSKEKAFHAQRKEREVEWTNAVASETVAAGAKAQKVPKCCWFRCFLYFLCLVERV